VSFTDFQDIRTRLAAMQRNITGIKKAFDKIPRTIERTELPCFVNLVGAGNYDLQTYGRQMVRDVRTYRMLLFVKEVSDDTESAAEEACYPFFDRVRSYFLARPGLELDGESPPGLTALDALLQGDSGVQIITYAQKRYAGIEFRILIPTLYEITYKD
jgi:hypothetical protein